MRRNVPRLLAALSLALLALAAGPPITAAQTTAIVGATLIDGNGGTPLINATIVIRDDRIVSVGTGASIDVPTGAVVIDATGKFVTPGFVREAQCPDFRAIAAVVGGEIPQRTVRQREPLHGSLEQE